MAERGSDGGVLGISITSDTWRSHDDVVMSHFDSGVPSFRTGYLFRTSPGWAPWVRGCSDTKRDVRPGFRN
jgi:hypothetical protein